MTLLEYALKLDTSDKVIQIDSNGQIVININELAKDSNSLSIEERENREILEHIIREFKWKDTRHSHSTKCSLPADVFKVLQKGIFILDHEQARKMKALEVVIDPAIEQALLTERKPYYRIRGKSVTEDQAVEIIRRTDWVIDHSEAAGPDYVFTCGLTNSWLCSKQ